MFQYCVWYLHKVLYIQYCKKTANQSSNAAGPGAARGRHLTVCPRSLPPLLHHHAKIGPYKTQHIITFLDALHDAAEQARPEQPRFAIVWDNVIFHRAVLVWL